MSVRDAILDFPVNTVDAFVWGWRKYTRAIDRGAGPLITVGVGLVSTAFFVTLTAIRPDPAEIAANKYAAGNLPAQVQALNQQFKDTGSNITAFEMNDGRKFKMCFSQTGPDDLEGGHINWAQCRDARLSP